MKLRNIFLELTFYASASGIDSSHQLAEVKFGFLSAARLLRDRCFLADCSMISTPSTRQTETLRFLQTNKN
jgi:hypothetical protein